MINSSVSYINSSSKTNKSLQGTFNLLDIENSGKIKKSIIISAAMHTSDHYDRKIIEQQLQKCPQLINLQQFQSIFELATIEKQDSSANWIFKLYDKNRKGYIDKNDLIRASMITGVELSEDEINSMLRADNEMVNGKVYFEDFSELMKNQISFS